MPANNLSHFTSTTGPEIVRSDRYPADLNGDLLFADPVGRFIRRSKIVKTEGLTQVRNAYPGSEFIISSDPLFRPVNIKQGPDGAIYILDMYHGIIQDANWTAPWHLPPLQDPAVRAGQGRSTTAASGGFGTTACRRERPKPEAGSRRFPRCELGRTWPRMNDETPAQLVAHLTDPNGWWRDTAQRLLVLKQDKSVVPALQQLVRWVDAGPPRGSDPGLTPLVGRFHAMWTLEGLGALDAALVREQMKDANPRMRIQAIRASETLYKAGNRTFDADYHALAKDPDTDVAIQALLDASLFKAPDLGDVVKATQAASKARGVKEIGDFLLKPPAAVAGSATLTPEEMKVIEDGSGIYQSLCFSCHGDDGRGTPLAGGAPGAMMAPPLAGSPRVNGHRDYVIKVLLKGMTGPLGEGTASAADIMQPMGSNTDAWVASIASYVRSSFGNAGGMVTSADVARVRAATASRKNPWTLKELQPTLPRRIEGQAGLEADGESQPRDARRSRSRRDPGRPARRKRPGCGSRSSSRSRRC